MDEDRPEVRVDVRSLYGHRTRHGIVQLQFGERSWQITAEEARRIGRMLLEAAEAADTDELVMALLTGQLGLDDAHAVVVLRDLRALRQAKYGDTVLPS